jgi:hypothetical protein
MKITVVSNEEMLWLCNRSGVMPDPGCACTDTCTTARNIWVT